MPGARPGWNTGLRASAEPESGPLGPSRGPFLPRLGRLGLERPGCALDALPGWGMGFRALGEPRNGRRGARQRAESSPVWRFFSKQDFFSAKSTEIAKPGEESHLFQAEIGEFWVPGRSAPGPKRSRGARPAPWAPFLADFAALAGEGETRLGSAV